MLTAKCLKGHNFVGIPKESLNPCCWFLFKSKNTLNFNFFKQ